MDTDEFNTGGCGGTGGAGCDCEDCEAWRRYCYWNHAHAGGGDDDTKQFLLFASDEKDNLRIPQEIASHLRNMISEFEPVKLEGPNGCMYHVVAKREFVDTVLRSGWEDVVDAHHIEENNPILFVYRGNSSFKVHIFNSSGREKFLSCSQPPCDHHVLNEQVVPHPGHVHSSAHFGYTMLPGSSVTKAQDDKLLEWAHTIKSGFPLFVAAMDKSNVSLKDCHIYIPLRLVGDFKEEIVKIVAPDESIYSVGASKHNDDQIVLQSGWDKFVASQCIQENDFLIFIIEGKTRLKVLVLDPSGSEKTFAMGNSSNAQETREDSIEIVDKKPAFPPIFTDLSSDDDEVMGKDTTTSRREQRPLRGCRAKAELMASTSSPSTKSGYKIGKLNQGGLEAPMSNKLKSPYMLPEGTNLTRQQKAKVEEKVRAIGSEFPVFVKVMTAHSVWRPTQLNFCMEYASACLPLEQTPLLLGLEGSEMQWPTTLLVSKYKNGRRITTGWKDLVSQAGMEGGDICLVELADRSSESLTMTVHLIRKSEMQL